LADLFEKDSDMIGLHIGNILQDGELQAEVTTEESSVVQTRSCPGRSTCTEKLTERGRLRRMQQLKIGYWIMAEMNL
jgi:hypothetical protein